MTKNFNRSAGRLCMNCSLSPVGRGLVGVIAAFDSLERQPALRCAIRLALTPTRLAQRPKPINRGALKTTGRQCEHTGKTPLPRKVTLRLTHLLMVCRLSVLPLKKPPTSKKVQPFPMKSVSLNCLTRGSTSRITPKRRIKRHNLFSIAVIFIRTEMQLEFSKLNSDIEADFSVFKPVALLQQATLIRP